MNKHIFRVILKIGFFLFMLTPFLGGLEIYAQKKKDKELGEKKRLKLTELFIDANKEKALGNGNEAIQLFEMCLTVDKNHTASLYELSKLYTGKAVGPYSVNKEYLEKALVAAKKAVKIEPENVWYLEHIAQIYDIQSDYDKLLKVYDKLLKISPYNVEYMEVIASVYEEQNKPEKAIEMYNKMEQTMGVSAHLAFKKSGLWLKLKKKDEAVKEMEQLISENPTNADYYQKLAEIYVITKDEEKVLETYQRLKDVDPDNGQVHLFLYSLYNRKGEEEKAFEELKLAFEDKDLNIDKKMKVVLDYYVMTETDPSYKEDAQKLIDLLIENHPEEAKSYAVAGDYYLREEKKEKALNYFKEAVELDDSRFPVWTQIFILESDLQNFEELATLSERCKEVFPTQPIVYYFNGFAHMQLNNHNQAIDNLELGKSLLIDNLPLLIQFNSLLGDAYYSTKQYQKSDEAFSAALDLDSTNVQVLNNYAYYLSERDTNLELAEKMSKRTLDMDPNSGTYADTYAWILYKLEKYEEALEWIQNALDWGGAESGVIVEHHGDILFKQGREKEALEKWLKAKELGDASEMLDKKIQDRTLYE